MHFALGHITGVHLCVPAATEGEVLLLCSASSLSLPKVSEELYLKKNDRSDSRFSPNN